ncbi:MAG: hypothetical protein E6Y28_08390 [Staphylococcus epidermidis]|nr:hypothetical protein [Staphylococcus epidermidis]
MGIKDVLKKLKPQEQSCCSVEIDSWIITIVVTINLEFCKNNIPLINKRATNSNVIVWNLSLFRFS